MLNKYRFLQHIYLRLLTITGTFSL